MAASKPTSGSIIEQFRRLVWDRLTKWEFLAEVCKEIQYGEIRIIVHDGAIHDIHLDFHLRKESVEDRPAKSAS